MKTYDTLFTADTLYMEHLEAARSLDPLDFASSGLNEQLRGTNPVDTAQIRELAARAATLCSPYTEPSVIMATHRDIDKIFGHFSAQKQAVPDAISKPFLYTGLPSPHPRANVYEYAFGSQEGIAWHTYTNDAREHHLLGIFREYISTAHAAIRSLVVARENMRLHGDSLGELRIAQDLIVASKEPMVRTYRDVTPEFFNLEMTRRWRPVSINGTLIEGPNASHHAQMAVDRLIAGDFKHYFAGNAPMEQAYKHRFSTMPSHLIEMIKLMDVIDPEPIQELAKSPDDRERSLAIAECLRRTKTMHKSYADKGLKARGKTLSPDDPDVLTGNINMVRAVEGELRKH